MNTPENKKTNEAEENNITPAYDSSAVEENEDADEIKDAGNEGEESAEKSEENVNKEENAPEKLQEKADEDTAAVAQEEADGEGPSETTVDEDNQEKYKSKKSLKPLWISLSVIALIAIAVVVYFFVFSANKPFERVILEAGESPLEEMFFDEEEVPENVIFSPKLSEIAINVPGEYPLDITIGRKTYKSVLEVEDTVAPVLTAHENVTVWSTTIPEPSEFIAEISDKTDVTLEWTDAPVLELEGKYTGKITATDLGGNKTETEVTFALVFDTRPPTLVGVKDIEAFIGNIFPDYMEGVSAVDDKTGQVIIEVDDSLVDIATEGKYTVVYKATDLAGNTAEMSAIVNVVQDKVAPVINGAVNCNIVLGASFDVLSYIKVTDNWDKDVKVEITQSIDSSAYGQYPVSVRATDFSGNTSDASFTVTVGVDTVAPVIVPTDIWVYEGDTVSYRKTVTVMDNFYPTPKLTVDSSSVNLNVIGNYTVKYTVTDASGNTSSAQAPVYVIKRPSIQELTNDMADKVLSQITNDSMTMLEKIYAVYKWVNKNVRYIGTSDKSSYIAGAYEGLSTGKGDCYTYYAVARVFLDRLGVANIEMKRTGTKDRHFWNLVNLGNGWYHYDCSYFNTGNGNLFMVTDSEAFAWDDLHFKGEHRFDYSPECPERATESMQYVVDYKARKIVQEVQTPALSEPLAQ